MTAVTVTALNVTAVTVTAVTVTAVPADDLSFIRQIKKAKACLVILAVGQNIWITRKLDGSMLTVLKCSDILLQNWQKC